MRRRLGGSLGGGECMRAVGGGRITTRCIACEGCCLPILGERPFILLTIEVFV